MTYYAQNITRATGGTLYAFPVGYPLASYATYRVLFPEDNKSAGRYNGSLDSSIAKIWKVFSGATTPTTWADAVDTIDLNNRILLDKLSGAEDEVFIGGIPESEWTNSIGISDGTGGSGRTYMMSAPATRRIRHTGKLTRVRLRTGNSMGSVQGIQLRIFRGGTVVGRSEYFIMPDATYTAITWSLESPIDVVAGDYIGIHLQDGTAAAGIGTKTESGTTVSYNDGDRVLTSELTLSLADTVPYIACFGPRPDLCLTGDSIAEGHNAGTYHGFLHAGVTMGGTATAEIGYQIRQVMGGDYTYENHALGSQTYAWVASTGIPSAVAANPKSILIICGVNDASAARTWAAVLADLDTIRGLVPQKTKLFISEITPYTAGSDVIAARIREWNVSIKAWCAANGAYLIAVHDEFGQARVSTGELDDLQTAYSLDGIHYSAAGVLKFAQIAALAINQSEAVVAIKADADLGTAAGGMVANVGKIPRAATAKADGEAATRTKVGAATSTTLTETLS